MSCVKAPMIVAVLALAASVACNRNEASNLEKLAANSEAADGEAADSNADGADTNGATIGRGGEDEGAAPQPRTDPDVEVDEYGIPIPAVDGPPKLLTPGADDDQVRLHLALAEGAHYRVTTIGMLELPLLNRATGFAREEDVSLSDCEGEGAARSCLATHVYRNYEAEPPAGSGLEADEALVAKLETAHRIDATGLRTTVTAVHGESTPQVGKQLAEVHRLFCLRLPAEPVGVGASWRDVCRMRQGGSLVTRELTWRLAKVDGEQDGRRAQLEYAGRVRRRDNTGTVVSGEVKGVVYYLVDAGEPHLVRERIGFVLNADQGIGTQTDFRYQFTKVGEDGETLIRTDGEPFDGSPQALNDLRAAPSGATRDTEQPAADKPQR